MIVSKEIDNSSQSPETRQRLLDAAGEVFADVGFHRATVRDILHRAGVKNVAAVNYYFGDKERLYAEVLRYAHGCAMSKYPPDMGLEPGAGPEQRLFAFVKSFLYRILDEGRPAWHGKLIAREIAEPTAALQGIVDEGVRPHFELLVSIVTELLGAEAVAADPDRVRYSAWSIVGQCLFYFHARPIIHRLYPPQQFKPEDVEALARHITAFSLAALKDARRPAGKASGSAPSNGGRR